MKKLHKNLIEAFYYKEGHPTESNTSIGNKFGVNRKMLAKPINFKDYTITSTRPEDKDYLIYFSPEEMEIINKYDECLEIGFPKFKAKYPNCPDRKETLMRWLTILGIDPQRKSVNRYNYDRTKFETIETEEDAYWLGFITADGCIIDHHWVGINLADRDVEHLRKFGRYMGLNEEELDKIITHGFGGAYTRDNPIVAIKICSQQVINNLKDKGITERKSGHEQPYKCKNAQLQAAYYRGVFDGDGYIRTTQTGIGLVGSYDMCQSFKDFFIDQGIDLSNNKIYEHGTIFRFATSSGNKTAQILNILYKDATIYLDRKYDLYKKSYRRV